jgi:hypothetical protein
MNAGIKQYNHQTDMKTNVTVIDHTLESLDGIDRATADADLYFRLQARLAGVPPRPAGITRPLYWTVAAGLALLIGMNFLAAFTHYQYQGQSSSSPSAMATDYFSYLEPINL